MVQSLDESVGRVLAKLEETGQTENTIIIFTADNGANGHEGSGGLNGYKGFCYEGGTREPFMIKGPGITPGRSDEPVIGMDMYPTILELTGCPARPDQHQDGLSLALLLRHQRALKERSLFWHYPHYHRSKPHGIIRKGKWKLIEFYEPLGNDRFELYNLDVDRNETNNVSSSMPELVTRLHHELIQWRLDVDAQMPIVNPEYDSEKEKLNEYPDPRPIK